MKTSTLLLVVSLAANAALVAAVALRSPAAPAAAAHPAASAAGATVATGVSAQAAHVPVANLWSRLHAGNYDEFRDRLRAAGFPAKAVRALLGMAISDESRERREAVIGKMEDVPYWRYPAVQYGSRTPEQQAQLREASRETNELFNKYANTPDVLAEDEDERNAYKRRYGDLPVEKLQQLVVLQRTFEKQQEDIYSAYSGGRSRDAEAMRVMRETQEALEKTRVAELAKVLDPAELEQYELRNSPASGALRYQLALFQPTEGEFKALYALRKNLSDDPAQFAVQAEAFKTQAQAVLGADRYAEYAMAMTSDGQGKLGQLIGRLELPLTTITTINGVRDDIRQRAQVIGNDTSLAPAQREAQLSALAQEADQRLTSTLGQRGYDAYVDLKGDWIRALKPKK